MAKIIYLTKEQVKAGKSRKSERPASFRWREYNKLLVEAIVAQNG